jgi:hypothetical protein
MEFQIGYEGVASTELSRLLHAVERSVIGGMVYAEDAALQSGVTAIPVPVGQPCPPHEVCVSIPPHDPEFLVLAIVALVFAFLGFWAGRAATLRQIKSLLNSPNSGSDRQR